MTFSLGQIDEFAEQVHRAPESVSIKEIVDLCAIDSLLYAKTFFPKTCRMGFADFHPELWSLLDGSDRFVNMQVFRGGAKTSTLRIYTSKRIAYGQTHIPLYIGKSEGHALRSVNWIRRAVEFNQLYSSVFGLRKGSKWQEHEAEIYHGTDEYPIWLLGAGITGSVRGINFDDYRPDLIVVDDVIDDENAATADQREKINNLIHGAVKQSLAPATETPDAKMAILQTPCNKEDASTLALSDPEFISRKFPCWQPQTMTLDTGQRISAWEERYPTKDLRKQRNFALARNKLSVWLREMECEITSPETSAFKAEWLEFYDLQPPREELVIAMGIDPVPPPTEVQIAKGMKGKDYESFAVMGRMKGTGKQYVLEVTQNRGHDPDWTIAEFFRLIIKWRPRRVRVETYAYQKTLEWLLRKAMKEKRIYVVIDEQRDRRSKYDRITDALSGLASNGQLYARRDQTEFISQFTQYPDIAHDDVLEAVAIAAGALSEEADLGAEELQAEEDDLPALEYVGGAP